MPDIPCSSEGWMRRWRDDGIRISKKGPEPLLIDTPWDRRQGLPAGADHEDAALILPLKSRLPGRAHHKDDALLNAHHSAGSGSHEIILHNKHLKMKK